MNIENEDDECDDNERDNDDDNEYDVYNNDMVCC